MEFCASESYPALLMTAPCASTKALLSVLFSLDSLRACSFSSSCATSNSLTLPAWARAWASSASLCLCSSSRVCRATRASSSSSLPQSAAASFASRAVRSSSWESSAA